MSCMLKKIPTSAVTLGMYVHAFDGAWLSHPFWNTQFRVVNASELDALKASGVPAVWIDVTRGLNAPPGQIEPLPHAQAPQAPQAAAPPNSIEGEIERAAQVIQLAMTKVTAMFEQARLGKPAPAAGCFAVVDAVSDSLERHPSALLSLARLKTKDAYTCMHAVAVCGLMISLARQLGMGHEHVRKAGLAGLLLDIGKASVPREIVDKPGKLTLRESAVMQLHAQKGSDLLRESGPALAGVLDVCLHHHEKFDGSGYPDRLAGEQISLLARMAAVCDVYDAITSTRPHQAASDPSEALQLMAQWTGHFDPSIFRALVSCMGAYPTGTLVRMQSGRLGVVVEQSATSPLRPKVRLFFSARSGLPIPVRFMDLSQPGCPERILGREPLEPWGFTHLDQLWNPLARRRG